jgi:phage I-like protein
MQTLLAAAERRLQGSLNPEEEVAVLYEQLSQLVKTTDKEVKQLQALPCSACCSPLHEEQICTDQQAISNDRRLSVRPISHLRRAHSQQCIAPDASASNVTGSAAVAFARVEHSRACRLQEQVAKLQTENALLTDQVAKLKHGAPL